MHQHSTRSTDAARRSPAWIICAALALSAVCGGALPVRPAMAQAIALSVNGDPITSYDLEQRMKLLRAMHKPASRDAAVESMIGTRLKEREASRFGISIKDDELGEEATLLAKKLKTTANALLASYGSAGVSPQHVRNYLRAELGYSVLIRALNRGVEASEIQVRQEMAKEKNKGGVTSYTIRQIVFTLNPDASPEAVNASVKEAEALRSRFTSCETGIPYAKTLPGVAVREKLTRNSTQLNDGIREVLDKTPVGHMTNPSRSPNGVEVVALCDKSAEKNDDELRKTVAERILAQHFEDEAERKFKELRAHAVIERHG